MNARFDYSGRVVVITGGAKGVGIGISECFLKAGATVVVCGRSEPDSLPKVGDNAASFIAADIRKTDQAEALFAAIDEQHGRIDVLVNNAGGAPFANAADASPRFHDSIIQLNLLAPFHLAQLANRRMQSQDEGGTVIFIGSVSALRPSPGTAAYGAAKAGILNLTQSLAVEWAPKVRVVSVSPGLVQTEQSELHYGDAEGIARVAATVPAGRLATPHDIGDACLFMASENASYVSGENLTVHGGGERPAFLDAANANKD